MKKVLIIANSDVTTDPRPYRMNEWLKTDFQVNTVAFTHLRPNRFFSKIVRKARYILFLLLKRYDWVIDFNSLNDLKKNSYDYIVCHDLYLLSWAIKNKKNAKIIFDAREYYPKQGEDSLLWKFLFQKQNIYWCATYLKKTDLIITVSEGISAEYKKEFNVNSCVIPSFSDFKDLQPRQPHGNKIRIIHHGMAASRRQLETMIYTMDYVNENFELDLMLVSKDQKYMQFLQELVKTRKNVKFIPPISFKEIVSYVHQYDIGFCNLIPSTFNLRYVLPNKFFEYIQARLMIITGPSPEMSQYVKKYGLGVVSSDFNPKTMAQIINSLTPEQIYKFKKKAHEAAKTFCSQEAAKTFRSLLQEI